MRATLSVAIATLSVRRRPASGHAAAAQRETRIPDKAIATAAQLRETALASDLGYRITESLTTEVGPRLAGSEADARAVAWARGQVQGAGLRQGLDRAGHLPEVGAPQRERAGAGRARAAAAPDRARRQPGRHGRGRSRALRRPGRAGSRARPVRWPARSPSSTTGWNAPATAPATARARACAAAVRRRRSAPVPSAYLMRSAGTDSHRNPHTGITRFDEGLTPIPSAALAVPDADQLARLLARGPVTVRVALDCGWDGTVHLAQRHRRDPRQQASPTKSC